MNLSMRSINWKLIENIISLFAIKGFQYILNFITFPFLVRVLNVDGFGQLSFVIGVVQYFLLFSNFGFDLSAPKAIARHDKGTQCSYWFSSIYFAKIFILVILTLIFGIFVGVLYQYFHIPWLLYCVVYLNVIGTALFPIWFFQGIQQMRYITLVSTIGKIISVGGVFLFVSTSADILWAAGFLSCSNMVAALLSWIILWRMFPSLLRRVKWKQIKRAICDSFPYFTSMIAINMYTNTTIVLLGLFSSEYAVGLYSASIRIIDAIRGALNPIVDSLYPYIVRTAKESKNQALIILRKLFWRLSIGTFFVSIGLFFTAWYIVNLVMGSNFEDAVPIFRVLSFVPTVSIASTVLGFLGLITFGYQKQFTYILCMAAIFNLIIVYPLIYYFDGLGAALALLLSELSVFIMVEILNNKLLR